MLMTISILQVIESFHHSFESAAAAPVYSSAQLPAGIGEISHEAQPDRRKRAAHARAQGGPSTGEARTRHG